MPIPSSRVDGTQTRQKIVNGLRELRICGKRPTASELADHLSMSPTNIRHHLRALRFQGLISVEEVPSHCTRQEIVLVETAEVPS